MLMLNLNKMQIKFVATQSLMEYIQYVKYIMLEKKEIVYIQPV